MRVVSKFLKLVLSIKSKCKLKVHHNFISYILLSYSGKISTKYSAEKIVHTKSPKVCAYRTQCVSIHYEMLTLYCLIRKFVLISFRKISPWAICMYEDWICLLGDFISFFRIFHFAFFNQGLINIDITLQY